MVGAKVDENYTKHGVAAVSFSIDNDQNRALGHPGQDEAVLAIVFAVVKLLDRKGIAKTCRAFQSRGSP
jgi:hypothetical protein